MPFDGCQLFIPIVTANSLQSRYTALEVEYALRRRAKDQLTIVPLVSERLWHTQPMDWPGPYVRLMELRCLVVDFHTQYAAGPIETSIGPAAPGTSLARAGFQRSACPALEVAVHVLCQELGVPYEPPRLEDPRLPFLRRFFKEMEKKCPHRKEYETGVYRRLMNIWNQFALEFVGGNYDVALARITYFVITCEEEYPKDLFYYPYVVKGVCELSCHQITEARRTFLSLRTRFSDSTVLDENPFCALGCIEQQMGNFAQALDYYRQAQAQAELHGNQHDLAADIGVLANSILCDQPIDATLLERLRQFIATAASGSGLSNYQQYPMFLAEDFERMEIVLALADANMGNGADALKDLSRLLNHRPALDLLIHYADLLKGRGKLQEAIAVLERYEDGMPDRLLWHRLACFLAAVPSWSKAATYFRKLVTHFPHERQYLVEAALASVQLRQGASAMAVLKPLLSPDPALLPRSADDFYYEGFAQWLVGNSAVAEHDFRRSGRPCAEYYANQVMLGIIPLLLGKSGDQS